MKFFAFGLGYQGLIDPGVGRFIARFIGPKVIEMAVMPCTQVSFSDEAEIIELVGGA